MRINILCFKEKKAKNKKHPHKEAKDTKKEKRISVGNLTGYDDIVWGAATGGVK